MTPEALWQRIQIKPFIPLRLITTDGKRYEVAIREAIAVTKSRVTVSRYGMGEIPGEDLPSNSDSLSPESVERIEDVRM